MASPGAGEKNAGRVRWGVHGLPGPERPPREDGGPRRLVSPQAGPKTSGQQTKRVAPCAC